ncbi:SDR family NAD(P)-dependent oxidoreductase, partial [Nocardioides sp.]|uniref:SDR family NAD(P)-dependent oxidoreductase n=1 Tax=Nocardioides sp. TaxID=35761 RepID=UPI0025CC80CF
MTDLGYAEAHDTSIEERYEPAPLLRGKVIVISGIGPGLGRALAEEAAKMGADLVIASRTESRLLELQADLEGYGGKVVSVVADVTDEDSRVNLRDKTLEAFGRVDCVINNAFTIPPMDPITQIEPRKLAKVNETNVFAPLRLSALFADALAEAKGSIIMLNSCVVFSSQPEYAGYKLSKGT